MSEAGWSARTSRPLEPPLVEHRLEFPGRLAGAEVPAGPAGGGDVGREGVRVQPGDVHQPGVGQRRGHREPDGLAAHAPAAEPGPGGMVAPPAAGQLVHDLQAAPGHGLGRHPGGGRRRAVPPAAVAVEHLADQLTAGTEAAQVEPEFRAAGQGAREGRGLSRGLRGMRGCGAGPAGGIGSPPMSGATDTNRSPPPPVPATARACSVLAASSLAIRMQSSRRSASSPISETTSLNTCRATAAHVASAGSGHA